MAEQSSQDSETRPNEPAVEPTAIPPEPDLELTSFTTKGLEPKSTPIVLDTHLRRVPGESSQPKDSQVPKDGSKR